MAKFYTVKLCDDKYEFDVSDDTGLMLAARRNGEFWDAGMQWAGSKAVMAMLWRIHELEDEQSRVSDDNFFGRDSTDLL